MNRRRSLTAGSAVLLAGGMLGGWMFFWPESPRAGAKLDWRDGKADLLAAIDPARDNWAQAKKGSAHFINDVLVIPPNTRVMLNDPLPTEYQLDLLIEQRPPVEEAMLLVLSPPGSLFGLVIGGPEGGRYVSGLQNFGQATLHPATVSVSDSPILKFGEQHCIQVTLRRNSVVATVDEKEVLNWSGGMQEFAGQATLGKSLIFTTNLAEIHVHQATVLRLNSE